MHTAATTPALACPLGVSFTGLHCGIKRSRADLGLIIFDRPCVVASCVTQNPVRAACVDRTAAIGTSESIRAIVVNSGNANALTGAAGVEADKGMAAAVAEVLRCEPSHVLTSSTGVIGVPLNLEAIAGAAPSLVAESSGDPSAFAQAILTTDTCTKLVSKTIDTPNGTVTLLGVAKGSGMIHPNMATTLGFVVTDALVSPALLERLLQGNIDSTFNAISVDGDTSTNDAVFACATGASGVGIEAGPELDAFATAFHEVLLDLAKQVAADGEGATRLLTVEVEGAPNDALAQSLARGICRGSLFKCSVFSGEASAFGRLAAAAGQCALEQGIPIDLENLSITAQGIRIVEGGAPVSLATHPEPGFENPLTELLRRLRSPEVTWSISIGDGEGTARAYGCDLTYDYVRINADESLQVEVQANGAVGRALSLARYSPKLKHELLVDGLAYVRRFAGMRVAIDVSGNVGEKPLLLESLCEDLDLLVDAGLRPWVLTHDEAVSQALLDGLTPRALAIPAKAVGETAELGRLIDRGVCVVETAAPDPSGLVARCIKLGVGKLLVLGDDQGLSDRTGLVSTLSRSQALAGLERGRFRTGSAEYLAVTRHAANQGLPALHLIDGRLPHALVAELFTTRGIGTLVTDQS